MKNRFAIVTLGVSWALFASSATTPAQDEGSAIKSWLSGYDAAFVAKDLDKLATFYHPEVTIYEGGGINRGWADYRDHHIGPELGHFTSFKFSDYTVAVRLEGPIALATETYRYTIVLKDKPESIERQGVATNVTAIGDRRR